MNFQTQIHFFHILKDQPAREVRCWDAKTLIFCGKKRNPILSLLAWPLLFCSVLFWNTQSPYPQHEDLRVLIFSNLDPTWESWYWLVISMPPSMGASISNYMNEEGHQLTLPPLLFSTPLWGQNFFWLEVLLLMTVKDIPCLYWTEL